MGHKRRPAPTVRAASVGAIIDRPPTPECDFICLFRNDTEVVPYDSCM